MHRRKCHLRVNDGAQSGIQIVGIKSLLQRRESVLTCAMPRRDKINVIGVMQSHCEMLDVGIFCAYQMESSGNQPDVLVDGDCGFHDLLDARMGAANDKD